ncbi:nucleoporin NUP42 [Spea bombifrons]|uniref:nucleoporin NUP42 n=1 Tax=Spea bombifrons TaxID=233779 RepID=UPI00234B5671|nr:nucleoporin NUP42 [Spea bombifrons]
MAICQYFLEGRCRYGDKCWNEHTRGGGGGGRYHTQTRHQQPPSSGGSHIWKNAPTKQAPGFQKSTTWSSKDNNRGGFGSFSGSDNSGNRNFTGSSGFQSTQNRFSALGNQGHSKDSQADQDGNLIDDIKNDMVVWESTGQWQLSVYAPQREKHNISGFSDVSPEELRVEYYMSKANGNAAGYINTVQQMVNQWKQRLLQLKNLNPMSRDALLRELTSASSSNTPATFGAAQQSTFAPSNASSSSAALASFSFKSDSTFAQNVNAPSSGTGFTFSGASGFGSKPSSTAAAGSMGTASAAAAAATFSFARTTAPTIGTSGFGVPSVAPSFGMPSTTHTVPAFGAGSPRVSGFGGGDGTFASPAFGGGHNTTAATGFSGVASTASSVAGLFKSATAGPTFTTSIFGQPPALPVGGTATNTPPAASASDGSTLDPLFTPRSELSPEDLLQFTAKKFTLGKIPLEPPPADLVNWYKTP